MRSIQYSYTQPNRFSEKKKKKNDLFFFTIRLQFIQISFKLLNVIRKHSFLSILLTVLIFYHYFRVQ